MPGDRRERPVARADSRLREAAALYEESGADARLVEVLLDRLQSAPDVGLALPMPSDPHLKRLCAALLKRPAADESLAAWARRLQVSPRTLTRRFQHETGMGFRAWRQRMRMLHALPALERGESITTVALDHGYDSVSAFIAAFHKQFGSPPRQFVKRKTGERA